MKRFSLILLAAAMLACVFSGCAMFMSTEERVEKYVELNRGQLDQVAESAKDVMEISCFAEGKSMILQYDYLTQIDADPEKTRSTLDTVGESYKAMFDELSRYAGSDEVSIKVRYNNKDGSRILEYVVDKDYVPAENASSFDPSSYNVLADYVYSDPFRAMISAQNNEYYTYSAEVENENTLVVIHRLNYEYSDEDLAAVKEEWDEYMAENGPSSIASMMSSVRVVMKDVEPEVVYRLLDCKGNVLSEYPAE